MTDSSKTDSGARREIRIVSDRKIEVVARNELGLVVALITSEGVVDALTASCEIAHGDAAYVTGPDSWVRVPVRAISDTGGAYLYANWDGSQRNNLNDLAAVRVRTALTPPPVEEKVTLRERATALWERLLQRSGLSIDNGWA